MLVTTSADGTIHHWHLNTGKALHTIKEETNNNLFCLDFSPDGKLFAVGG